jgi:hypothetical protein
VTASSDSIGSATSNDQLTTTAPNSGGDEGVRITFGSERPCAVIQPPICWKAVIE